MENNVQKAEGYCECSHPVKSHWESGLCSDCGASCGHQPKAEGVENKGNNENVSSKPSYEAKGNPATDKGNQAEGVGEVDHAIQVKRMLEYYRDREGCWFVEDLWSLEQDIYDLLTSATRAVGNIACVTDEDWKELEEINFHHKDEKARFDLLKEYVTSSMKAAQERGRKEVLDAMSYAECVEPGQGDYGKEWFWHLENAVYKKLLPPPPSN